MDLVLNGKIMSPAKAIPRVFQEGHQAWEEAAYRKVQTIEAASSPKGRKLWLGPIKETVYRVNFCPIEALVPGYRTLPFSPTLLLRIGFPRFSPGPHTLRHKNDK